MEIIKLHPEIAAEICGIIMWDNRASIFRGRPWPLDKPRYMIRTTIAATDADGVAELRPPQMPRRAA